MPVNTTFCDYEIDTDSSENACGTADLNVDQLSIKGGVA